MNGESGVGRFLAMSKRVEWGQDFRTKLLLSRDFTRLFRSLKGTSDIQYKILGFRGN